MFQKLRKQRVLVINNYDSFTYNLVQLLGKEGLQILVFNNDEIKSRRINALWPDKILISPGPGRPENSKASLETIENFYDKIPILGICLGHQAIAIVFGGNVIKAPEPVHGKISEIFHQGKGIYSGISSPMKATRYHSLIVEKETLPAELKITAQTDDGLIMGLRHKDYPLEGIQFHPESILTRAGYKLIRNWLSD